MMFDRLRAICAAETDNLAELADIAAPGDAAFFDGAQFAGADLRGTNLTRFNLLGAMLRGAKIDDATILPDATPLVDLMPDDKDVPHPVHFFESISAVGQKEGMSTLDRLEKITIKQDNSNIKGPVSRRSSNIPVKYDSERTFKINSIRRMRSLAREILVWRNVDLTIGVVLKNIECLVEIIQICESVMRRCEPRAYERFSHGINLEIKKLGIETDNPDGQVSLSRQQWKAILAGITSQGINQVLAGGFGFMGASGDIYANLIFRLFLVLEESKDFYLALPVDQQKIDPVSFQTHIYYEEEVNEPYLM